MNEEAPMSSTLEALEAEALQLPEAERARLVERLIASLDADPKVEEAWAAEVERRLAAIE
ncbi:MAG TPA: addiction module protein, partial [Casimicrobiaceae bacterium]